MESRKKCVNCGKEYTESSGYGYCLLCEEGIDHANRDCHLPSAKEKRKLNRMPK